MAPLGQSPLLSLQPAFPLAAPCPLVFLCFLSLLAIGAVSSMCNHTANVSTPASSIDALTTATAASKPSSSSARAHSWLNRFSLGALALCAIFSAGSATLLSTPEAQAALLYDQNGSQFSVFGQVQAAFVNEYAYQDMAYTTDNSDNNIYARARIGLAGRTQITNGLDAIMMAQWNTSSSNEEEDLPLDRTEYMFAGIDAYQYGTLILGRGDGAYYTVAGATDIFNIIDGHASDYYILGDQRPSQIMYSLRALSWDLKLSYMFATNDLGDTPLRAKRGMGASVSTKFGENITFAYGIDYTDFRYADDNRAASEYFFAPMLQADNRTYQDALAKAQSQHVGDKTEYGAALSYGVLGQGFYGALVVGATKYAYMNHHLYTVDSALNYTFANGMGISLGYGYKGYDGQSVISELSCGASYQMNAAFKLFAEAQWDLNGHADEFYGETIARELNLGENKYVLGAEFNF